MRTFFLSICFLCLSTIIVMAIQKEDGHEDHDHGDSPEAVQTEPAQTDTAKQEHQPANEELSYEHPEEVTADFSDFPNLHPLVVHVPVIFLILAIIFQVLSFLVFKEAMSWCALGSIVVGFIGAYAAAVWTHPHVEMAQLPEHAKQVYETHDLWATWTLWLGGIGSVLKILSHFLAKRKVWAEIIVLLVFLGSGYAVAMAGHHGAQLVFIEGIGPKGKYLQTDDHDHDH